MPIIDVTAIILIIYWLHYTSEPTNIRFIIIIFSLIWFTYLQEFAYSDSIHPPTFRTVSHILYMLNISNNGLHIITALLWFSSKVYCLNYFVSTLCYISIIWWTLSLRIIGAIISFLTNPIYYGNFVINYKYLKCISISGPIASFPPTNNICLYSVTCSIMGTLAPNIAPTPVLKVIRWWFYRRYVDKLHFFRSDMQHLA